MIAWIVYSLAFSALVALAALAAEALLRMYGLPTRGVWAAAVLLSCAAPLALAERPREAPVALAPSAVAAGHGAPAAPIVRGAPPLAERVESVLPVLWLAASALLVAGIAAGVAVLRWRRRGWRAARLADVPVLLSHDVGPAVVGVVRPAVVVPRWTLTWAEPMQRLVVRHEGEHIRARDPLLILAATLAAALVPWNLALWFQLRRLRLAVEVDCDARTLRGGGDVATYGDLLLRVGARGSATALAAAFAEPRSFLERRIRAMTDRTPRNRAARAAACAVLTLGVAATGYALPAPAHPALFANFFAATVADPIRVSAVLTPADTAPVYDIRQVEQKPALRGSARVTQELQRAYPAQLRDAGISGTAVVEFVVRPDGSVSNARVVSATRPEFGEPARGVVSNMRFQPGRNGGQPVAVRVQVPITFEAPVIAVGPPALPGVAVEPSRTVSVEPTSSVGAEPVSSVAVEPVSSVAVEPVSSGGVLYPSRVDGAPAPAAAPSRAVAPSRAGAPSRAPAAAPVLVPSKTAAPAIAPTRSVAPAPTQTTLVTTARTTSAAPARAATRAQTTIVSTAPTRAATARTTAVAPARAVTTAPTTTVTTTARTSRVAPARIAPVTARGRRPARAPDADPTPELLGRVIDPNAPPRPPAPAQP